MHTDNAIYVHVVFSTKNRKPQIDTALEERLYPYIGGIIREMGGKLLNINGVEDHVHLLISMPPTISIATMVHHIKGCSSKWIHATFPGRTRFEWQRGYGAFSVSQSALATVSRYFDRQKVHHAKRPFRDECRRLLERHEINRPPEGRASRQ